MEDTTHVKPVVDTLLDNLKNSIEQEVTSSLSTIVENLVKQATENLVTSANAQISAEITQAVSKINVSQVVTDVLTQKLDGMIRSGSFPKNSIPQSSIDFAGVILSGSSICGGIVKEFSSTGIEDRASFVQLTLMDHASVFEGPVFAPELTVKGSLLVEGDLKLDGVFSDSPALDQIVERSSVRVKTMLNDDLFASFSDIIFDKIQENGLSLDKINQDGRTVLDGNKLGYHITESNLQRLGIIRDFQTVGENYLSETLYVSGHRVGVNTMDPSAAFVVWDEECEIITAKRRGDVGYIGTPRAQQLVLGSNNKENLILDTDGSVHVKELVVNNVSMTSSSTIPTVEGKLGQLVFNERPALGRYLGWVCIGGNRWASFGKVE